MKKTISTSLVLLLAICAVFAQIMPNKKSLVSTQSLTTQKSSSESDLISYRSSEMKCFSPKPIDIKQLVGYWISLDGKAMLKIHESNNEILAEGDYFPGVIKNGDKATLAIKTSDSGYYLQIYYEFSRNTGGGGGGINVVYYSIDDHLVVGKPPYHEVVNGQLWTKGINSSSDGIYGKEFKRVK